MTTRRDFLITKTLEGLAIAATPLLIGASKSALAQAKSPALEQPGHIDTTAGSSAVTRDPERSGTIDRLYVLNGGIAVAPDRSVYSPGRWKGEQVALSCNVYLLRRAGEWVLWDTGIEDAVANELGGRIIAHNIRGIVVRAITRQLADMGITPADVGTVVLSHAHFDHVGNAALFRHATWYIQRREHEAMFGPDYGQYGYSPALYADLKQAKVRLMDGDLDVFGDGSIKVISTPGHTPGHCSLLVRLAKTGPILLSADVAH